MGSQRQEDFSEYEAILGSVTSTRVTRTYRVKLSKPGLCDGAHLNVSTWEAEAGRALNLRPACYFT